MVKVLLERNDVDPNKRGLSGETPLWAASDKGHECIVKMLLERSDVDPNKRDFLGETPLGAASKTGHEGIVKMLLDRNANPHKSVPHWSLHALALALLICILFPIHIVFSYLRVSMIEFVFIYYCMA